MFNLFSASGTAAFICLMFAGIFLLKDKGKFWKITIVYLILVVATEILAKYCAKTYRNNIPVYNIYSVFELSYISYAFYYFMKEFLNVKWFLLSIYSIIFSIYIYFSITNNIITVYNSLTISIMSVFFVIYGLLYFYLLLKDENYIDLKFHPAFWWVGGTIIFYFGGTIANFFDDIIQQMFMGKYVTRHIIYTTLNVFLYSFWSYSFICRARQRKICQ